MDKRPTIRDIAAKAGYHYSTVSLALRNNPRIPKKTRDLIHGIAADLKYRPDPMLSALTAYRRDTKPRQCVSTIAWVTNHSTRDGWKDWHITHEYYKGAKSETDTRGYRLNEFWLQGKGMTERRLNQILETRNIQGILLPPQEKQTSLELNWRRFSAVTFGYSLTSPELHMVTNHEYRNMRHLMKEVYARGYKRPGLVGFKRSAERVEFNWLAAFMLEQLETEEENRVSPLILDEWDDFSFMSWFEQTRPDVIITRLSQVVDALRRFNLQVPEDVGLGFHSIQERDLEVTGIRKNAYRIGVLAADLVIDMIHRNETGVPRFPQRHLMEGCWEEADTLRPREDAKVAQYLQGDRQFKLKLASDSNFLQL